MKIHYLQHVPFEGLGSIENWALTEGHQITSTRLYENQPFPGLNDFEWLVIMGGAMSVNDTEKIPWLAAEKKFIHSALRNHKTVLGICLGAQLIANVLGATVYPGRHKEIGWHPIKSVSAPGAKLLPDNAAVFHWHGETFDLPRNAVRLAESAVCENQAFLVNENVLGLQFHLESTPESVSELIRHCGDEIVDGPFIQTAEEMLVDMERFIGINSLMDNVLNYLSGKTT